MKEYCIFVQYEDACPYRTCKFNTLLEAENYLLNLAEEYENKRYVRKNYYIDNDFFENKYILGLPNQTYYQIQSREVSEWENVDKNMDNSKNDFPTYGKIIKFHK